MNKERMVSVSALIRRVLEKWRWLLAAGLIAAVLAAGYKAFGLRHLLQSGGQQEQPAQGEETAESGSVSAVDELGILDQAYSNRNTYISESLLFRINPEAEGRASFLLQVEVPEEEPQTGVQAGTAAVQEGTAAAEGQVPQAEQDVETVEEAAADQTLGISVYVPKRGLGKDGQIVYVGSQNREEALLLKSYLNFIEEGIDWTELAQEYSTRPQYLQELVEVEEYTGLSGARITVIFEDAEGAQRILGHVRQELEAYTAQLQAQQVEHTLTFSEEKAGIVVDPDMEEWLVNQLYSVNNLYTYKTTLGRSMGSGGASAGSGGVPMGTIVKILVKFAVFGFVLGIILFAGIYVFILLVSGSVLSGKEFNAQYNLRRLAVFPGKTRKNPIDRAIAGMDSSYLTSRDRKECFSAAVANVRAQMAVRGGTVAVISDLPAETVEGVAARLNAAAKGTGLYFAGADLGHSAEGVNTVSASDAVLVLAQCGRSRYGATTVLLDAVQGTGKKVLGSIVL